MENANVILAEYPGIGRVHLCECGAVHLSIGPATLNLEHAAFFQMAMMICNAADRLTAIREARPTPETLFEMLRSASNERTH